MDICEVTNPQPRLPATHRKFQFEMRCAQIVIQLGRFNKQVLRALQDREDERANVAASSSAAAQRRARSSSSKVRSFECQSFGF